MKQCVWPDFSKHGTFSWKFWDIKLRVSTQGHQSRKILCSARYVTESTEVSKHYVFRAEHHGPSMFFRHLSTFQKRPLSRMAALSPERRHLYLMRGLHLVFLFAHEKHLCHIEFGTLWERRGYEYKLFMFVRFCVIFPFSFTLMHLRAFWVDDVKCTRAASSGKAYVEHKHYLENHSSGTIIIETTENLNLN